ncbi:hypothetical protein D9M71_841350 [compost metagenome]
MDQRRTVGQLRQRQQCQVISLGQGHGQGIGDVQLDHGIAQGRCIDGADEQIEHIHAPVFPFRPQRLTQVEREPFGGGVHRQLSNPAQRGLGTYQQ